MSSGHCQGLVSKHSAYLSNGDSVEKRSCGHRKSWYQEEVESDLGLMDALSPSRNVQPDPIPEWPAKSRSENGSNGGSNVHVANANRAEVVWRSWIQRRLGHGKDPEHGDNPAVLDSSERSRWESYQHLEWSDHLLQECRSDNLFRSSQSVQRMTLSVRSQWYLWLPLLL